MFNGIVLSTGKIKFIKRNINSILFTIETNLQFSKKDLGSSVSCDGVCLTIVKIKGKLINFYVSKETLDKSNLNLMKINQIINLEKSLSYGQKISGHFTQGHVDTTAKIKKITFYGNTWLIRLQIKNRKYKKLIVEKASISINGVSLTVSKVFISSIHPTLNPVMAGFILGL